MTDLLDYVNEQAGLEDQTVDTGGNFEKKIAAEGRHPARLVAYVELGNHEDSYNGQPKPDAPYVMLTWEFLGSKDVETIEKDGTTIEIPVRHTEIIKKSFNEKSKYRKLFESMRDGDETITHMAQMLVNKTWLVTVEHNKSQDGKKTYANIYNKSKGWLFAPAVRDEVDEDGAPTGETIPLNIRPAIAEPKLLFWDNPKPAMWQSIYIDGTYTKKDKEGNEQEVSKNWIQERCMSASNFEGSAVQAMIAGIDKVVDDHGEPATEEPEEKTANDEQSEASDDDALAAMGL